MKGDNYMTNKEAVENNNVVIFEADDVNDSTWDIIISVLRENIPGFHVGYGNGNYMAFAIPKEFQRGKDNMIKFDAKDFGSNINIFVNVNGKGEYVFDEYHDHCIYFPYKINFESIVEKISDVIEIKLNTDEIKSLESKIGTWLDAHSCEDDEYYKEEN